MDCVVVRNVQSGVVAKDVGSNVKLVRCRLSENGRYGLSVRERERVPF